MYVLLLPEERLYNQIDHNFNRDAESIIRSKNKVDKNHFSSGNHEDR